VDGFFVTLSQAEDARGREFRHLELLVVLGIRRDRAGFSVIPFGADAGPGTAADWAGAPGRDAGADFENVLPGGEIGGLYSLLTVAEVLKLVGRSLWYLDRYPGDQTLVEPDEGTEREAGSAPVSRLACWRVSLGRRRDGA
jgi:hypothetical protein